MADGRRMTYVYDETNPIEHSQKDVLHFKPQPQDSSITYLVQIPDTTPDLEPPPDQQAPRTRDVSIVNTGHLPNTLDEEKYPLESYIRNNLQSFRKSIAPQVLEDVMQSPHKKVWESDIVVRPIDPRKVNSNVNINNISKEKLEESKDISNTTMPVDSKDLKIFNKLGTDNKGNNLKNEILVMPAILNPVTNDKNSPFTENRQRPPSKTKVKDMTNPSDEDIRKTNKLKERGGENDYSQHKCSHKKKTKMQEDDKKAEKSAPIVKKKKVHKLRFDEDVCDLPIESPKHYINISNPSRESRQTKKRGILKNEMTVMPENCDSDKYSPITVMSANFDSAKYSPFTVMPANYDSAKYSPFTVVKDVEFKKRPSSRVRVMILIDASDDESESITELDSYHGKKRIDQNMEKRRGKLSKSDIENQEEHRQSKKDKILGLFKHKDDRKYHDDKSKPFYGTNRDDLWRSSSDIEDESRRRRKTEKDKKGIRPYTTDDQKYVKRDPYKGKRGSIESIEPYGYSRKRSSKDDEFRKLPKGERDEKGKRPYETDDRYVKGDYINGRRGPTERFKPYEDSRKRSSKDINEDYRKRLRDEKYGKGQRPYTSDEQSYLRGDTQKGKPTGDKKYPEDSRKRLSKDIDEDYRKRRRDEKYGKGPSDKQGYLRGDTQKGKRETTGDLKYPEDFKKYPSKVDDESRVRGDKGKRLYSFDDQGYLRGETQKGKREPTGDFKYPEDSTKQPSKYPAKVDDVSRIGDKKNRPHRFDDRRHFPKDQRGPTGSLDYFDGSKKTYPNYDELRKQGKDEQGGKGKRPYISDGQGPDDIYLPDDKRGKGEQLGDRTKKDGKQNLPYPIEKPERRKDKGETIDDPYDKTLYPYYPTTEKYGSKMRPTVRQRKPLVRKDIGKRPATDKPSEFIKVKAPKSATKIIAKKRYHVQIPQHGQPETWFNARFNVTDENNVDMNYEGPVKISNYYSTNKYL